MGLCLEVECGDGFRIYFVAGFDGGRIWAAGVVVSGEEPEGGSFAGHCVDGDGDCGVFVARGGPRDDDVGGDFGGELLLSLG